MKKTLALSAFLLMSCFLPAQEKIVGRWRSTNGLARDVYDLKEDRRVTREFIGDLSYYKLAGSYRQSHDSVFIHYEEPGEEEKKIYFRGFTPPLNDTIYIVGNERMERRIHELRVSLYRHDRQLYNFSTDDNGILNFKVDGFGDTVRLMHYRNFFWQVIAVWSSPDEGIIEVNNYALNLHSGKNEFRLYVGQLLQDERIKWFTIESKKPRVHVRQKKFGDTLYFTSATYFVLRDQRGHIIKSGTGSFIECAGLPSGKYTVDFDNQWETVKKK